MNSVSECQQIVDDLIAINPNFAALLNSGGEEGRIKVDCRMCKDDGIEAKKTSFMTTNPNEVVLCANYLKKSNLKKELTFHATQAYDLIHQRTDFRTCDGLAYAKVRAIRDSHCTDMPFEWMTSLCVYTLSGAATKALYPQIGDKCVAAVYDKAMADKHPIAGVVDPLSKINKGPAGFH